MLFRAATDMGLFERALEDQGLRTYLIGGRGFWGQRQVQDVVAYLTLIANPRDDLRLYEVLASPMVARPRATRSHRSRPRRRRERSAWEMVAALRRSPGVWPASRAAWRRTARRRRALRSTR